MLRARVIGKATSTVCHPGVRGNRHLICAELDGDGRVTEKVFVAADGLGAGIGNEVVVSADGDAVQLHAKDPKAPLRNAIVGIVDGEERG